MKVLWITSMPSGIMNEIMGAPKANGGGWVSAVQQEISNNEEIELTIVSTMNRKDIFDYTHDGVRYICLNAGHVAEYKIGKKSNIRKWESILQTSTPDIIHIWGTEYSFTLDLIRQCKDIPIVYYINGIPKSVYQYYNGGLSCREILRGGTVFDLLKYILFVHQKKYYKRQIKNEKLMINIAGNIITESLWFDSKYLWDNRVNTYHHILPVDFYYFSCAKWNIEKIEGNSIFCVAGHYPLKGIHQLIKALALVKEKIPNVKLYIPGANNLTRKNFSTIIKRSSYLNYIKRLIKKFDLESSIVFLGSITKEQMAEYMRKCHVFVMPSWIETHSCTLREAMAVGTPSIASAVGCIHEYVSHGVNGLLYRADEYETLASEIHQLMVDNKLSVKLSKSASSTIKKMVSFNNNGNHLYNIYKEIVKESEM